MKTVKYLFAAAALLFTAAACQKTTETPETTPSEPVLRTFTCTFAGDSDDPTKVAISNVGKSTWEVGDEILIHGKYAGPSHTKTVALTAENISADGKTASFTVDLTGVTPNDVAKYNHEYLAAYPASAVGGYNDGDNIYYYNCFSDTNHPLMAGYIEDDIIHFYNCTGVISFTTTEDVDSYVLEGANHETVGYTYYRVKVIADEQNFKHTLDGAQTSVSGDVTHDGTTLNYVCFPNGANFTGGFKMTFLKGGVPVKTLSVKPVNVARGKILPLGNITPYMKDYVAPVQHDNTIGVNVATATDLSVLGSANCYIVDAAGDYKFKAVKGNSSDSVGDITSVEILWETWNNTEEVTTNSVIAAADYDLQEGEDPYIVFKTPDLLHVGNALIAAKNAGGQVLWSWHIWLPMTAITDVDEANFSTKKTMSRNLGALVDATTNVVSTVQSFGLLYEWGRKDPFPGLGVLSGKGAITVAGTAMTQQEGPMTVEDAIKNPTVYVYKKSGDWAEDGTDTANLWGETTKTVYDPCPVGYMLPQRNKSCAFWSGTKWTTDTDPFHLFEANCSFSVGSLVFPLAGYIDAAGEGQKKAGTRTIVWSGRWDSGTVNGYGMYGYTDDGIGFRCQGNVRSRGGSVRCVAE